MAPPGLTADGYWGDDSAPVAAVALGTKPAAASADRAMLTVAVYPAGKIPYVVPKGARLPVRPNYQQIKSHVLPASSVDGREAYWYSSSATDPLDGGQPMLRWRTADGR